MQRTPIKKAKEGTQAQAAQEENVVPTNSDNKPPVVEGQVGSTILRDTKFESPKSESVASPTPSEKELEEIKNRTAHQEKIVTEKLEQTRQAESNVQEQLTKLEIAACQNRQHEFETRTKTHLAVPAKKFIQACQTLVFQLDRTLFSDEISHQYGDQLLNEVLVTYEKVEEARAYCLEPLTIQERENPKYEEYMRKKFEARMICERMYKKYFEEEEEKKRLRQGQAQAEANLFQNHQVPPPVVTSAAMTPPTMTAPMGQNIPLTSTPYGLERPMTWQEKVTFYDQQAQRGFNPIQSPGLQESRIPSPIPPSVQGENYSTRFKLIEELSLVEKWDGTNPRAYMAFRAQWTNFEEKMKRQKRSNLDLYYALLKVLDGTAKNLVRTKYPNDQSYGQAILKLDSLFYNPANLIRDMVHNLLKGVKMVDTYESLMGGMTKLWDAWSDLDQADLTKGQLKGLLFIAATEKNLSEESWKCWLETQNDPKYRENPMAAFEISAFMGAMQTALLNAQKRKNAIGATEPNNKPPAKPAHFRNSSVPGKKQSTLYGSYSNAVGNQGRGASAKVQQQAKGQNGTCIFCNKEKHYYQLYCLKLKNMNPNQIYQVMQKAGIECQMCLGLGHRTKDCPASKEGILKKCKIQEDGQECQRMHCRFLHNYKKTSEEPKGTPTPQTKQE